MRLFSLEHFVPNPFIPQTCLCVIFAVLGLGALNVHNVYIIDQLNMLQQISAALKPFRDNFFRKIRHIVPTVFHRGHPSGDIFISFSPLYRPVHASAFA